MTDKMIQPPHAAQKPHRFTFHGKTIDDPWAWLRDPGYPEVRDEEILSYLRAENAWFEQHMEDERPLIDSLYAEMRARIPEADSSVPQKLGDYLYWSEFAEGAEYKRHWRKPIAGGADELLLDVPALAEGHDYFSIHAFSVSRCGRRLAYSYDDNGSERYTVRVKDLTADELLPDIIEGTYSSIVWTADGSGFLYCPANDQWRTDRAMLHRLGDAVADDRELYHENNNGFRVTVGETQSERFLVISTGDHETSETWLLPADDPDANPFCVSKRQTGREYDVEEHDGKLYILANDTHPNFRLATASLERSEEWTTLIEGSDDFYITGMTAFADFYTIEGRRAGLDEIQLRSYDDPDRIERIEFPEASYSAELTNNPEYGQQTLRLSYDSMVTPDTVYDYDVAARTLKVLKLQKVPSGYDPSPYVTERLMIEARDGTLVPCSILYRKDRPMGEDAPLHLYGYGAYGHAIEPGFSTVRLSLVDRGFAYAIAHIRGGDDLGRQWYLDGKLTKRTNTFNDFVDVAKGLVDQGYVKSGRISISGGSAGGELMGAVVNSDPDLFGAVVAHVPFVDVLSTMLDESLPLTPGEWPEWGNPIDDQAAFDFIRSYSPYDNVRAQDYPPMLVTAGLNDPRVTYWEPAKWVAKLRELKTDKNMLLLKTNMEAGHGGKSGRWESLKEAAEEYAFILKTMKRGAA